MQSLPVRKAFAGEAEEIYELRADQKKRKYPGSQLEPELRDESAAHCIFCFVPDPFQRVSPFNCICRVLHVQEMRVQ